MQINKTGVTPRTHIEKAYTSLFGHIARLDAAVPAHQAALTGMPPFVVAMEEGRYTVSGDYALMISK